MKNPFNTIFWRSTLASTSLLVLAHLTILMVIGRDDIDTRADHVVRDVTVVEEAREHGVAAAKQIAASLGESYLDSSQPPSQLETHGLFENALRLHLPPGSKVVLAADTGTIWIRYGRDPVWIRLPGATWSNARKDTALGLMLALSILVSFIVAWFAQRPLRRLASAAREFRIGVSSPGVPLIGPRETVDLIRSFNDMTRQISEHEQERALMLAGVAHDLRTPLTRIQVRADLLAAGAERKGFLDDVESLDRIGKQFLDFVRERAEDSPAVSVDAFCQNHYRSVPDDDGAEECLLRLDLRAGSKFKLPLVDLDRILANLLENAMTYGEPPVEMATTIQQGECILTLRDHGAGIPVEQMNRALQPFVRLDAARGGDAHCGLGLSIVRRLVRRNGGTFALTNAASGGLEVKLTFPATRVDIRD